MRWALCGLLSLGVGLFIAGLLLPLRTALPYSQVTFFLPIEILLQNPHAEVKILVLECLGIGWVAATVFTVLLLAMPKAAMLHGNAAWASLRDVKNADPKLLGTKGIFLGQFKGFHLFQQGQSFVLVTAGTRGGKGVSIVIPNLLSWSDSMVVTDIKLENYKITAGYREACGQKVYLFAPGSQHTHRWNPLDLVSRDPNTRIADIQNMATLLVVADSGGGSWVTDGRQLFLGIGLLLLDNPQLPFTLGEIYRQMNPPGEFGSYHQAILDGDSCLTCINPEGRRILASYANMNTKQFDGVRSHVNPILQLFANPLLDAATSQSDFDLSTLRTERQTIYLGINPKDIEIYEPLLKLFYQQLINVNLAKLPGDDPYQVMLLMDEFAALGQMPALVNAVSFMAGYNLRFVAIVQSVSQIRELYRDKADTLIENIHTRVFFAAKNIKNAADLSAELGDTTVTSHSRSRQRGSTKLGSESTSQTKRALLLPQEAKAIGSDAMIVLSDNCPPIKAKKVAYYRTPLFLKRCLDPDKKRPFWEAKTQETLLRQVRTPSPIAPLLTPTANSHTDPYGILPESGVTADNVEMVARRFLLVLTGERNG